MTAIEPPKPEPVDLPAGPGTTTQPPALLPLAAAIKPVQVVTPDMDMVDRVMITHPGLTRETAQQALDEAGY